MRCITNAVDVQLPANGVEQVTFKDIGSLRCVMLMIFREKSISLYPLHAVNFIVSYRVMASIKKPPGPKRHTFVYAKEALASKLLPKSLCLVMQSRSLSSQGQARGASRLLAAPRPPSCPSGWAAPKRPRG